jgi:hypothetical protein
MDELPDINSGISKPELFEKFKLQLQKDMEYCGLNGKFVSELIPEYQFIVNVLHSELEKITKISGKLNELLYRIDISESQIKKASASSSNSFNEIVAELIVKRELQKIIIKEHFKNK